MQKYHTLPLKQIFSEFKSGYNGLTQEEACLRLKRGKNKITTENQISIFKIFLDQFSGPLILLLIIASAISFALGRILDGAVITVILILNALLGFAQEYKAEKSLEEIKKLSVQRSVVIRGKETEILSEDIVVGDLVVLNEGDIVPADMRIFKSFDLHIDESLLTGESVPVAKISKEIKDCQLSDRKNMAYAGTVNVKGRGYGIVVATGRGTELGKVAGLIEFKKEKTHLQKKINYFGKKLAVLVVILTAVVFGYGFYSGLGMTEMLMTAISLAVSAVPEGLPAIITLVLALGVRKMSKKNALVRKLGSIETLGAATVICADKTGTMTSNEMMVVKVVTDKEFDVTGSGFKVKGDILLGKKKINPLKFPNLKKILEISYFCNNSILKKDGIVGGSTEGALRVLAEKVGFHSSKERKDEIPFSSERKMMSTVYDQVYTKGAPETVLKHCNRILVNGKVKKITKKDKVGILEKNKELASQGLRVLGFCYNKGKPEHNMIFVGLVGMVDPPKPEVKGAIEKCLKAGIRTIMITGDHVNTAKFVANEIGLIGQVMSGEELDKLGEAELRSRVNNISIFARLSPAHKIRVLQALQANGEVVAITGDGVNDAPALVKSDIGVSMGKKGTDVARQSSDIVLMDDNFSTIVSSIEEGRGIYDNIRRFITFLLSANFDEILVVFVAIMMKFPLPFLPVQILWMNLLTDGLPALALGVEPREHVMNRGPRNPKKGILSGLTLFIVAAVVIGFIVIFSIFVWQLSLGATVEKARTIAFTTAIFFELFLVFNCRSEDHGVFRKNLISNKHLLVAVALSILLQLLVIYVPVLQDMFGTVALTGGDWFYIILFAATGLLVLPEIFIRKHNYVYKLGK